MKLIALILLFASIIGLLLFLMIKRNNHSNKFKNTNDEEKIIDAEYEEIDKNNKKNKNKNKK